MIFLYIGLGLIVVICLVVTVRTIQFKPRAMMQIEAEPINLDEERIIESMKAMLKYRTISHIDPKFVNDVEFTGFRNYLIERYPLIHEIATRMMITDKAVLYKIKGESDQEPIVLMSHYDVVPENGQWKNPPFLGEIIDGRIYGRGSLDTKGTLCAVVESVEHLLKEKHTFKQDLYLAFCGDEEVFGTGAKATVDYFEQQGISPKLVLDEGGAVVSDVFPGVKQKAAVIGTAEKGFISMEVAAKSSGGHASMPPKETPITHLAKAITTLNQGKHLKIRKTPATMLMFDNVARHSKSVVIRAIFANLWLFFPLVKLLAKKSEGTLLSMMKTTQAFTMMEGSEAINVLPTLAKIGINYRILTGETVDEVVEKVKKKIDHLDVEVRVHNSTNPTPVSLTDEKFDLLSEAIVKTWGEVVTTPYLMMATTDSRHYHRISNHVYRFSAMELTNEERKMIHGVDESIRIDQLIKAVEFYVRLLKAV